ncbi:MAG: hypothetical protein Q8O19_02065 [Rectinemataceae bacterium]|nr:hypothetical protein [Rectinemataceae bacterium]
MKSRTFAKNMDTLRLLDFSLAAENGYAAAYALFLSQNGNIVKNINNEEVANEFKRKAA